MSAQTPQPQLVPSGALFEITESDEGQFKVKELPQSSTLPKVVNDSDRLEIAFDVAFLKLVGYIIPSTYEIGVETYFLGVKAGNTYYGSLTRGVGIEVEAGFYTGNIRIDKEGDEVVLKVDIKGRLFMPNISERVKLFNV